MTPAAAMQHPSGLATRVATALWLVGILAAAVLACLPSGATRMHAAPWDLLLWIARSAPVFALSLRLLDLHAPFRWPGLPWTILTLSAWLAAISSAALSPRRTESFWETTTLLAGLAHFLLAQEWFHRSGPLLERRVLKGITAGAVVWSTVSLSLWLPDVTSAGLENVWELAQRERNIHPFGHPNYVAGLALLLLPFVVCFAWRSETGRWKTLGLVSALLVLGILLASGSRAGVLGLAAMGAAAVLGSGMSRRQKVTWAFAALLAVALFAFIHPRTRVMFSADAKAAPNISNMQREAMLRGAILMGKARPLLGWGTGVTPLVYPAFRSRLDGGIASALQVHSLPGQVWVDFGAAGVLVLVGVTALAGWTVCRAWLTLPPVSRAGATSAIGYAVFSLTDYQLDIPAFSAFLAIATSCLAAGGRGLPVRIRAIPPFAGLLMAGSFVGCFAYGGEHRTARLNIEALALATESARAPDVIRALETSLAIDPDQEIAHTNLGWLLLNCDPAGAAGHFREAARLMPDKGGVYFGLGLTQLLTKHREGAIKAFALECLNNPRFQVSPAWREPHLDALKQEVHRQLEAYYAALETRLDPEGWHANELRYNRALSSWIFGVSDADTVASAAADPARRRFFSEGPDRWFLRGDTVISRTSRPAYPVLVRLPDLPPPVDVYPQVDDARSVKQNAYLFSEKGWFPQTHLVDFLRQPAG